MVTQISNMDGFRHAHRRDTFHPGSVHMMEFATPHRVRLIIEGPYEAAAAALHAYFKKWPTEGYGTHQVGFAMNAGHVRYVIERRGSCD